MQSVIIIGLAAGFWAHLLTKSQSMPKWWYSFQKWWSLKSPFGNKPFGCPLCMSFWIAVVFGAIWYVAIDRMSVYIINYFLDTSASTAISLMYIAAMEKLETFVIG